MEFSVAVRMEQVRKRQAAEQKCPAEQNHQVAEQTNPQKEKGAQLIVKLQANQFVHAGMLEVDLQLLA